jgi:hypothetical protein
MIARGGLIFVSKTAAVVLAFLSLMLFSATSKAQLLPSGNVYAGVGYADNVDVVNRLTFRGWEGSAEAFPFKKYRFLGIVLDGSGFYRKGVTQYDLVLGPRISKTYGKWRVFAHAMGGYQETKSSGDSFHAILEDFGGGADRKLPFKNFSWRLQFDYIHSHELSANQNDYRGTTGAVWRF